MDRTGLLDQGRGCPCCRRRVRDVRCAPRGGTSIGLAQPRALEGEREAHAIAIDLAFDPRPRWASHPFHDISRAEPVRGRAVHRRDHVACGEAGAAGGRVLEDVGHLADAWSILELYADASVK